MKTSLIILSIFLVLGLGLFFSNQFEHNHYAGEITVFRCERINHLPFPYDYIHDKKNSSLYRLRRLDRLFSHKSVNWFNTELEDLPDDVFENYTCIESIHLSNNYFTNIPEAIKMTPSLKNLYMSNNKLEELDFRTIDLRGNASLKNIYLSNNSIKKVIGIPNSWLNTLDLKNNEIENFGTEEDGAEILLPVYQNKKEISNIDLSNNRLKAFPSIFYDNLRVNDLNISDNQIEGNVLLSGMSRLYKFNMSHQGGDEIDELLIDKETFSNLSILDARASRIKSFRTSSDYYNNQLETIYLDNNHLKNFPIDALNFQRLETLTLSNNDISYVQFPSLHEGLMDLNLSNNKITTINKVDYLGNLRHLDLSDNLLTSVPLGLSEMDELITVRLTNNKVSSMPQEYMDRTISCQHLYLNDNKFSGVFTLSEYWARIQTLNLSNNNIVSFDLEGSEYDLLVLDLANNPNLKYIDLSIFEKAENLLEIVLIGNRNISKNELNYLKKLAAQHHVNLTFEEEDRRMK